MIRVIAAAAVILCTAACATAAVPSTARPSTLSAAASIAETATLGPTPSPRPLQSMLPVRIGSTELHTFPVGQDWLARLASKLGIGMKRLAVAYASDHGAAFVQMYAIRVEGIDTARLLGGLAEVAYPSGDVDLSSKLIAGRNVTVINQPATADRLGTFYAFGEGDTLIVAEAFAEPVMERAFQALPGS